jgi:hypothetical protein
MFARFTNGPEEPLAFGKRLDIRPGICPGFCMESNDRAWIALSGDRLLDTRSNIQVRHVIAPGAMGTAYPRASNESAQGRAKNRHVRVVLERC